MALPLGRQQDQEIMTKQYQGISSPTIKTKLQKIL
jgi:hypothetical protein